MSFPVHLLAYYHFQTEYPSIHTKINVQRLFWEFKYLIDQYQVSNCDYEMWTVQCPQHLGPVQNSQIWTTRITSINQTLIKRDNRDFSKIKSGVYAFLLFKILGLTRLWSQVKISSIETDNLTVNFVFLPSTSVMKDYNLSVSVRLVYFLSNISFSLVLRVDKRA